MAITIREAVPQDTPEIAEIIGQMNDLHVAGRPDFFQQQTVEQLAQFLAAGVAESKDGQVFVADEESRILGVVWVIVANSREKPFLVRRRFAEVPVLAAHQERRHEGIGKQLLRRAEAWAREKGLATMELNVFAFNTNAAAFYERMDFEPLHTRMSKQLE